jgi:hypothetical protein
MWIFKYSILRNSVIPAVRLLSSGFKGLSKYDRLLRRQKHILNFCDEVFLKDAKGLLSCPVFIFVFTTADALFWVLLDR